MLKDKNLRLGKGLGALIPDYDEAPISTSGKSQLLEVDINKIAPNPSQPRTIFNEENIEELAESIKHHGIAQPVLIRKKGDQYELVAGERRYRACKLLGKDTIPAIIKEISDEDSLQIALIENLQREDISPVEEAKAFLMLLKRFNYTQEELASKIGKSRPAISNAIRLLDLPDEILGELASGKISVGHARALLALPVNGQKIDLLAQIINRSLSVRQTEEAVRNMLEANKLIPKEKTDYTFEKESYIKEHFWNKFSFKGNNKKGQLTFKYTTPQEKEELLKKLGL